jgi:hypothetical protein
MQRVIIGGTFVTQTIADLFYGPMAQALDATVVALSALGLDHPTGSLVNVGMHVDQTKPVQLVGHSQGGVVAVLATNMFNVDKVVTIGAPLKGVAYPVPGIVDFPGLRFLHRSNPALQKLKGDPSIMTISSKRDMVVPPNIAHLEGSIEVHLDKPGHTWLPRDSHVIRLIKEFLDD